MAHVQRIDGKIVAVSTGPVYADGSPPTLISDPVEMPDDHPDIVAYRQQWDNPAPVEVERHQALLALLAAGVTRVMIEAAIAAIADPVEREITDIRYQSPRWRRDSDFIAWGKATFGLSDEQVAALFASAAIL